MKRLGALLMFTIATLAVPLAGVTESQAESLVALKFSVPEPALVTLTKAGDGSDELP